MDGKAIEQYRLALFGRMVWGVSHEVDNHLSVGLGFAELLQASGGGEKKALDGAGKILWAGEKIASIIQQFSYYVRPHAPVVEPFSFSSVLSEVVLFSRYDLGRGNVTFALPEKTEACRRRGGAPPRGGRFSGGGGGGRSPAISSPGWGETFPWRIVLRVVVLSPCACRPSDGPGACALPQGHALPSRSAPLGRRPPPRLVLYMEEVPGSAVRSGIGIPIPMDGKDGGMERDCGAEEGR